MRSISLLTFALAILMFQAPSSASADEPPNIDDTAGAASLEAPRAGCPRAAAISPVRVHLGASGIFSASYSHGGGCGKHDYCIGYNDADPANVEVWMSHIHDGTDHCEAELFKDLKVQLPPSILSAKHISLVGYTETSPLTIDGAVTACPASAAVAPTSFKLGADGTFEATHEHGGGCGKHAYCIGHTYDAASNTAQVWMGHLHDGTDMCEALLLGSATMVLPAEILNAKTLQLVSPGTPPKSLRD
jgi:hypothetical protein